MKKICFFILLGLALLFSSTSYILQAYEVIPGGENIGIEVKANGVLVIGGYDVITQKGKYNPTTDSDIKKGDLIYEANGKDVNSISDLLGIIAEVDEDEVDLKLLRNGQQLSRTLKLIKVSGANTMKTGLLVKERILGIGTVTFYDPNTKVYGALGHKLIDNDFSTIADINSGSIYESTVTGVKKSTAGNVGEILATIHQDEPIGTIDSNTEFGIFGTYEKCPDKDALEVATHDEIKLGKAYIYTNIDSTVRKYEIEITNLQKQTQISAKGISFKITDEDLLKQSGGIVQGMSGSPIIQNDKIIGAVTHVLVDSTQKGYGIYLDFMLQIAENRH